jgi:hypothetical protein
MSRLLNMETKVVASIRVGDMSLARYRPGVLPADFMRLAPPDPAPTIGYPKKAQSRRLTRFQNSSPYVLSYSH